MSDRDISDLDPQLQVLYREWKMQCNNAGLVVTAVETYRDAIAQDDAKAHGLSNASAGQSAHNCCDADGNPASRAFDFAVFDNGKYVTDGTDDRYFQAGRIAEGLGMVWGGRWSKPDYDHIEMANWKSV